jgi:hypothetical protein
MLTGSQHQMIVEYARLKEGPNGQLKVDCRAGC